ERSVVHERSGFRFGSLMYCELLVDVAPYSSPTVGKRTARPADILSTVSGSHCHANAPFGETCDSCRSGHDVATGGAARMPVNPSEAVHDSARIPSTARQRCESDHASCAYRLRNAVRPRTSLAAGPGSSAR